MKKLLVSLVLASSLALPTYATAEDFKPSSNIVSLMPLLLDNLDALKVSEAQLSEIRVISRKSFAEVERINAHYHVIKSELQEELLDFNVDAKHSLELAEELSKLDLKRMQLTVECANGLKKVLNQEQYEELIATLKFQY